MFGKEAMATTYGWAVVELCNLSQNLSLSAPGRKGLTPMKPEVDEDGVAVSCKKSKSHALIDFIRLDWR